MKAEGRARLKAEKDLADARAKEKEARSYDRLFKPAAAEKAAGAGGKGKKKLGADRGALKGPLSHCRLAGMRCFRGRYACNTM